MEASKVSKCREIEIQHNKIQAQLRNENSDLESTSATKVRQLEAAHSKVVRETDEANRAEKRQM